MERNVYLKLTSLKKAKDILFKNCSASPLKPETVPLAQAQGRTLAEPVSAKLSSPAFHGAAMDGITVAAEATFGASERKPKSLRIGKDAFWINTGHPLPKGCNAVIMVENIIIGREPDIVTIEKAAFPWQHVRKLGEDMVATEILLPPGIIIGPYELGALAAAGVLEPVVYARPKVAVIPSGSELVPLDEVTPELLVTEAKLPEFNSLVLAAQIKEAGGEPIILPIVQDQPELISEALLKAAKSGVDMVVINAGSSAGSKDYTASIISELGELWVHGISMMPGKPTALGRIENTPVLGIPGYPVSAILAFEELGQPLLALWQGRSMPPRDTAPVQPYQALPSRPGMEEFVRVKLGQVDNSLVAVPLPRGAGTVSSLSRADAIIRIPAQSEGLAADMPVPATIIRSREQVNKSLLAIGSHDNTLDLLDSFLRAKHPGFSLTSAHVGSMGGIMAIKKGKCHLGGSHLLGEDGIYNQAAIAEHLKGVPIRLLRLVGREQGLIVMPGNPSKVNSLKDLARSDVSFINRQRGSGTRVLLDWHLKQLGISPDSINGYEDEDYTHMNIAAAVLSGRATAGLGIKAAAVALGLEFIPVGVEEYDLVIPERFWQDERMLKLLGVIRSEEFKSAVEKLGGYDISKTGELIWTFPG